MTAPRTNGISGPPPLSMTTYISSDHLFAPPTSTAQTSSRISAHDTGRPWLSLLDRSPFLTRPGPMKPSRSLTAGLQASASASASTPFARPTSLPHPTPTQLRSHLATSSPTSLHLPDLVSSWPALRSWTLGDGLAPLREAVGEDMGVDIEMGPRGRGYLDERYRRVTMGFGKCELVCAMFLLSLVRFLRLVFFYLTI